VSEERLSAQVSPRMARVYVRALLGDGDWETPTGTPAYSYFATMDYREAMEAYEQIHQLPEGQRMRDLMERLGEDGRVS
jgi:hypothetical protein